MLVGSGDAETAEYHYAEIMAGRSATYRIGPEKVTIYQFTVYDISQDEMRRSRRWGTREAIERIRSGSVLEETATEVEGSCLDDNGMTQRDFNPSRSSDLQRSAK
jgi:hypothetical protein